MTFPVFVIHAINCPGSVSNRYQTGFLFGDPPRITTTLHGVIGCGELVARLPGQNHKRDRLISGLRISLVNIEYDTAQLSGPELDSAIADNKLSPAILAKVSALGPSVISRVFVAPGLRIDVPVEFTIDSTEKRISDFISDRTVVQRLTTRKSPSIDARVVTLTGRVREGQSGAPLIVDREKVAAFTDGGLRMADIFGWAIRLEDVRYEKIETAEKSLDWQRLVKEPAPDDLFSYAPSPLRIAGLLPSVSASLVLSADKPETQFALHVPFRVAGQRIAAVLEGGPTTRTTVHSVSTLAGVPPITQTNRQSFTYVGAGLTYHPVWLPQFAIDPYVRISVGALDGNYGRTTFAGGLDLFVNNRITAFVEFDALRDTVPDSTRVFNQYGEASSIEFETSARREQAMVGVRFSFHAFRVQ